MYSARHSMIVEVTMAEDHLLSRYNIAEIVSMMHENIRPT